MIFPNHFSTILCAHDSKMSPVGSTGFASPTILTIRVVIIWRV